MNTLVHREGDDDVEGVRGRGGDREITLGTMTILAIFFALAVLCAAFFGFGYSMGRKDAPPPLAAAAGTAGGNASLSGYKPTAGNPYSAPDPETAKPASGASVTVPYTPPHVEAPPVSSKVTAADGEVVGDPANADEAPKPAAHAATPVASVPMPSTTSGGSIVVQIAAVSHQEDADLLTSELKRRGYAVSVRNEPQDKLLHVQVGPLATKKDAEAMKQKLSNDGFNAIIKGAN